MKKFAKLLAMVLAVSMVLTMFVGAYNDSDKIVDEDKATAVKAVYEAGIMMGDDKGNFNPTAGLRRSEMAKILFALASKNQQPEEYYSVIAATGFEDYADIQNWAKAFIGYAYAAEYIVGTTDGNADANGILCYADAAIMLLRTLGLDKDNQGEYLTYPVGEDTYKIFEGPKAYQNAIVAAYQAHLFDLGEGTLEFTNYREAISREDVAVMIYNAMNHANAGVYNVAEPEFGTVTGTKTVDEEEFIVLDADDVNGLYPAEGLDVEALIGREINFVVEENEAGDFDILAVEAAEPVFAGEALKADIELVDVKDEEGNPTGDQNLEINGEVIVEKFVDTYTWYYAYETETYGTTPGAAAADYDVIDIVINENTICVKYAPVAFVEFNETYLLEDYNSEKKEYDGTYSYDGVELADGVDYEVLEDGVWYATQMLDGKYVSFEALEVIDAADIDAAYDAAADKYVATYNDVELVYYAGVTAQTIWTNSFNLEKEYFAVLYKGAVVVAYDEVPAVVVPPIDSETYYAIVNGYTANVELQLDDEGEPTGKYVWTVSVDAIVDNEATKIEYTVVQDTLAFVNTYGLAKGFVYQVYVDADADVENGEIAFSMTKYAAVNSALYIEKVDAIAALDEKKVAFIDCTESEVELDDITVETDTRGNTVVKVGEQKVSGSSIMVFWVETAGTTDYAVVVYDPAGEFGVWGQFLLS